MRKFLITLLFLFTVSAPVFAQSPQITTQMTTTTTATGTGVAVPTTGYHMITWTLAGPAPTACTVAVDSSADNSSWTAGGAIPGQTCTSGGQSAVVNLSTGYIRINVTAFTGSGTLKVFYLGTSGISGSSTTSTVSIGAPVGTCAQGALDTDKNTGNLYACNNGTWVLAGGGAGIVYSAGGGTAQAQTMTPSPAATSLNTGTTLYCWLPTAANSGSAPTLAISGLTAKPITKYGTVALIANDITTVGIACVIYDGTEFQLQVPNAGVVARTSIQAVGAAAQAMNLYTASACDGISACTGFYTGDIAPPTLVASVQWQKEGADGTGNAALVTNGSLVKSFTQLPQYIAGAGAVNVMTATFVPAFTSLAAGATGIEFDVLPNLANTTTNPTLNINGLGAKTVTKCGTAALVAGDWSTTALAKFLYDGTNLQLQNPQASPCGGAGSVGAPTYTFAGHLTSGLYFNSNVGPMISAAGADIAGVNSTGITLPNTLVYGFSSNLSGGTGPNLAISEDAGQGILDIGTGAQGSAAAFVRSGNTVVLTSNFTTASATLVTITGLSWTFPATNHNYAWNCRLSYSQATAAAADAFGVQAATTAPNNLMAWMNVSTGLAVTGVDATLPLLSTTTATNIGTFTPSAAGAIGTIADIFTAELGGLLEQGAGATTLNIMVLTGNVSDSITIYRGSSCSLIP